MKNHPVPASEHFKSQLRGAPLQHLFDFLPGIYFVAKNRKGQIMMANNFAVRLCGLPRMEDLIGKTDEDLFSKEQAAAYVKDDQHVFETGEPIVDRVERAPAPEQAIHWFITTKIPLYDHDDQIVGLACIARSTERDHEILRPYVELNEVLEYIRKNYASPIPIKEIAKRADLSPSQLERNFKKAFQITLNKHIQDVRIRAACTLLLSTHNTIASIAQDSGFYDHSHFSRCFKKKKGVAPSEFRKINSKHS
ncbi:MAG: AraC family transcriptional regulator [Pontiella sp.]